MDVLLWFVVEEFEETWAFLKDKVSAACSMHEPLTFIGMHEPLTFIGKHYNYESSRLTDNEQLLHQPRLPIIRKFIAHGDDEEAVSMWRSMDSTSFGPVYRGLEQEMWKKVKQEAWEYVLRNSDDRDGPEQTKETYIEAIKNVEEESRVLYGGDFANYSSVASLSSEEFIWIMILDGCFLLQVALFALGGSKQLHCPINDVQTFGVSLMGKELIRNVISSMFIVGNQIPILVLKELMKQSFFKKIVEQGKWQQPLDLDRWVLFDQILVPMLDVKGGDILIPTASSMKGGIERFVFSSFLETIITKIVNMVALEKIRRNPSVIEAHDLLEGLWLLMSGLSPRNKGRDFNHQINSDVDNDDIEHNSSYAVINQTVRSATELKEAGITFMCKGTRIKDIIFQKSLFINILQLPKIIIDYEMMVLFSNLIQYELSREDLGENRKKICGYLQFLRELIRTHDDVKLLAANGIIIVDPDEEDQLPNKLRNLNMPKVNVDGNLRKVRDELINYTSSINKKFGQLLSLVALLTVIQTIYSVLSYHFKN